MKVGALIFSIKGLESLIRSAEALRFDKFALEVHKDDDTHGILRVCVKDGSGWVELDK